MTTQAMLRIGLGIGPLWIGAAAALGCAVLAGWRDHRRRRRDDPDAIGMIDWPTVQVVALIAAAILCGLALKL